MQAASAEPVLAAPRSAYQVGGRRFETDTPGFVEAIAAAHAEHRRPLCLCVVDGIEMYVARLAGSDEGFIVKRIPNTGSHHAPDCPSYEPPAEFSGLGQVLGSAITEDPATGETTLKLDFTMSKIAGRATMPTAGGESDSVASSDTKLSLRGLLHYLWDQAELTRWQPGFAGKRTWGTVRKHLLQAAENKIARGDSLCSRLYIPESFSVEQRDAINARRVAQWSRVTAAPGKPQHLMLLIAEVKEIVPARYGFKAVVKHVPDQAFALDEQLYRRLGRRFESELALWGAAEDIHMVMIATFNVSAAGIPTIMELSLMPVTRQWLPVECGFEKQLVERLVIEGRSFVKGLRYNLGAGSALASATLTDCEGSAPLLFVVPAGVENETRHLRVCDPSMPVWIWRPSSEAMPTLPRAADRSKAVARVASAQTEDTAADSKFDDGLVLKTHYLQISSALCYHAGMREKHADKLLRLAEAQPAVSARELTAAGVPQRVLSRMAGRGSLRRVGRGLYTGTDAVPSAHQSVIEVAKQAPKAVVCLLSALEIHEVGVQAPFEVWIALPAGTHAPRIAGTAIRVTRLSGAAFSEGIETVVIDGAPVRVYNIAKTITDCFKLRGKVGLDVALEALREAWRARKVKMDDLSRYARVNRMTNVMRPYLEALTG